MKTRLAAAAIVGAYFLVGIAGLPSYGLTDDDDFYVPAGIAYAEWLGRALSFEEGAWSRASIDAAFAVNREHPPLAKYVFGLCHAVFGGLLGPTDGARVGTVLFSTLAAALLLYLAVRHLGDRRGLFAGGLAVLFLLLLPRFHFHSHAATLDVPVAAMVLLASLLALRGERSARAALLAGPAFGLAAATKLNAPFLIIPYAVFALLVRRGAIRRAMPSSARSVRLPPVPLALVSMLIAGPVVFLSLWPWLWFDTAKRLGEYAGFHLHHYGIYFLYFGRVFSKDPFAPWHAPFVMAAVTVPLAISALAVIGLFFGARPVRLRLRFLEGPDDDVRREGDLVLTAALQAIAAVAVVAFSGGPKYGGEKLFMPFFPFWCLLAGYGAERLYSRIVEVWRARSLGAATLALAIASCLALELRYGTYALSEYNGLAGGLGGATALGFERQYYDVAYRDLVRWLGANAPKDARLHFLPNNWEYERTYRWYRQAGELRADLRIVNREVDADLLVLTHERRFVRYAQDLRRYRGRPVLLEKRVDGVPLWTVIDLHGAR